MYRLLGQQGGHRADAGMGEMSELATGGQAATSAS
jgi:hypothetical protein